MKKKRETIVLSTLLVLVALVVLKIVLWRRPAPVTAEEPPDVLRLAGIVRDFQSTHPDFGVTTASDLGHCVQSVGAALGDRSQPVYTGAGVSVAEQWRDKDGNPIRPYSTDPGLPGGHFDVDVFDRPTDKELYHKHEFDDSFDVTYVDIVHDPKLLFDDVIGPHYPKDLRVEFLNPHHGSGTFTFEAGGVLRQGRTVDGFEATFTPSELTQLRVDFASLNDLRHTKPSNVQNDVADRDDGFAVRMYDVVSNQLVYELAVYHHGEAADVEGGGTFSGKDSCDETINDTLGAFSGGCGGGVTDAASFDQWFGEALGVNISTIHTISLTRNFEGVYEYLEEDFFPIDDRLFGNDGGAHNQLFTYAIPATFTHQACRGLFFEFEGNDDAWVFIDGKLVIDLGGAATPSRQYVALDRLGLVDGQEYTFHFFFAQRRVTGYSRFRMRTNIPLVSSVKLPVSGSYD